MLSCAGPDETIINHLCTAGLAQSVKLLDALHSTRLFLTEGQHSWGEPQTPCENAYLEFKSLHQQIGGMHAALAQHSKEIAGEAFPQSKGAHLNFQCRPWAGAPCLGQFL